MPTPFKNYLSVDLIKSYGKIIRDIHPEFNLGKFEALALAPPWSDLELKQRMRRITEALSQTLPEHFPDAAKIITKSIKEARDKQLNKVGIEFIFLPDFIEFNGLNYLEESIETIEQVTPFITCELAVRPFIIKYQDAMMAQMIAWSEHNNEHLRRLASEGSRPRLPWAIALTEFKNDPRPVLPILKKLKNDPSEYVRRSVANNLNDISKDNPKIAFDIFKKWYGKNSKTDKLVKHGMRTLLKSNYAGVMELIGYASPEKLDIENFQVETVKVNRGDSVSFRFTLKNKSKSALKVRLEYAIYFLLSNGKHSRKMFKISERQMHSSEKIEIVRKHSFRYITTRKYYPGQHFVSPVISGVEETKKDFELI